MTLKPCYQGKLVACFGVQIGLSYGVELEREDQVRDKNLVRVRGDRAI